jgi:glycosyltransferase involved in cell wall biosynthesis
MTPPRIAILAVHPARSAATRLRALQYGPAAAAAGLDVRFWSFLDDADLDAWYGPSHAGRARVALLALLRLPRIRRVIRGAAVVVVQREALPFGPPLIELAVSRRRRLVWDVDDALWEPYVSPTAGRVPRWLRATGGKFTRLCRAADEVWAGSEVLASWCRRHNDRVHVLPTVVDVPHELPAAAAGRTAAWIGSHSTGEFLEHVLPAVAAVTPPVRVLVVGARPSLPSGLAAGVRDWSVEVETQTLAEARIGLYPIDIGHPLANGKCGFKAVLYMAHGVPPIVTPTAANAAIVRDSLEGLHATSDDEWREAVQRLLDDPELWERCRLASHERARRDYSLERWAPWVVGRLSTLADC